MKTCPRCHSPILQGKCTRFPVCTYQAAAPVLKQEPIIFFDLETTGLNPKTDRLLEIGAVKWVNDQIVDRFELLVHPGSVGISPQIARLTGITLEMVAHQPSEAEAVRQFLDWCDGAVCFGGHNILRFDLPFFQAAAKRAGIPFIAGYAWDTLKLARNLRLKEQGWVKDYKQPTLCAVFHIEYSAHRALDDIEACAKLFQNLQTLQAQLPETL